MKLCKMKYWELCNLNFLQRAQVDFTPTKLFITFFTFLQNKITILLDPLKAFRIV